jgi:hypothetical protein
MASFHEQMAEYRKQMKKGTIIAAYQGLMDYMRELRLYFKSKYPEYFVSGSIYYGFMDMTYSSVIPESLKEQQLKIAIVFLHEPFRFEVWLGGYNRAVQSRYWKLLQDSRWEQYRIPAQGKGVDSILEYILVDDPDFRDLETMTAQIEQGTLKFINDVEKFFATHKK